MFSDEKKTDDAKQWLDKCYGNSVRLSHHIQRSSTGLLNFRREEKTREILFSDRKMIFSELVNIIGILKESILMKNFCVRWVQGVLNIDQKYKRVRVSKDNLSLIKRNKNEFLFRFVTLDETRVHHYTSNWQSAECLRR